ncbi:hypothetical protein BJV77DRAFT_1154435 [Russula vinacea]|nr:hypothetical protein BJV77DRAFT_1154435 [Russula vinacea]
MADIYSRTTDTAVDQGRENMSPNVLSIPRAPNHGVLVSLGQNSSGSFTSECMAEIPLFHGASRPEACRPLAVEVLRLLGANYPPIGEHDDAHGDPKRFRHWPSRDGFTDRWSIMLSALPGIVVAHLAPCCGCASSIRRVCLTCDGAVPRDGADVAARFLTIISIVR